MEGLFFINTLGSVPTFGHGLFHPPHFWEHIDAKTVLAWPCCWPPAPSTRRRKRSIAAACSTSRPASGASASASPSTMAWSSRSRRWPPAPGHIDLSAYSCLPGLIDMHVHLTGETQAQVDSLRDTLSANPADSAYQLGALRRAHAEGRLHHRARPGRRRRPEHRAEAGDRQAARCPGRACSPRGPSSRPPAATATRPTTCRSVFGHAVDTVGRGQQPRAGRARRCGRTTRKART